MQGAGTGLRLGPPRCAAVLGTAPPGARLIGSGEERGRSPDAQGLAGYGRGQVRGGRVGVRGRLAGGSSSD